MLDFIQQLSTEYQHILIWVSVISTVVFVLSLLLIPFLIGLIPADYFVELNKNKRSENYLLGFIWTTVKNILGFVLILLGLIMLLTPGQGILAIVLGLFLMEFPKKKQLELSLINHNPTFNALNWLRRKAGKTDFKR